MDRFKYALTLLFLLCQSKIDKQKYFLPLLSYCNFIAVLLINPKLKSSALAIFS